MNIILRIERAAAAGGFEEYQLDACEDMTVLDALESIRSGREPSLRYRHSCHHGSCGTCGAVINDKEGLMCLVRLSSLVGASVAPEVITVKPLRKMDAVGDLAINPSPLFESLPPAASYLRKSDLEHGGPPEEGGDYLRLEACIECGICVSACPVDGMTFLGPAALAMADRDREERPANTAADLAFAASEKGVGACKKAFACSRLCPQGVAPGRRIENLRKSLASPKA